MAQPPNELDVLSIFVAAHAKPDPRTGHRVPIWYHRSFGGGGLVHHGFDREPPPEIDEALLEEMSGHGLITIDYREHNWNLTPTPYGRQVVEERDRVQNQTPLADERPLVDAVSAQAAADNPLSWPAVRPVLLALRIYWQKSGFSPHGIALAPLAGALPDEQAPMFAATIRSLLKGEYLESVGSLGTVLGTDDGSQIQLPGEVAITEKAHSILDGWPGAAPEELVENLLAVLVASAANETDPARKRRLETLASTIREVGVSITSEVIAKVLTGSLPL
jgi:hypothetical protein